MRYSGMPQIVQGGVNVTPLIDIVMCMIVFFMLVAKIGVTTGAEADIDIPVLRRLGTELRDVGVESSLVLNVREFAGKPFVTAMVQADGTISKTGQPVELPVLDPHTGRPVLAQTLRRLRWGFDGKPGGLRENADNPQFKVIIRADRNITYATLEPILRACMEAGVSKVSFNTKKPAPT